MRVLICSAAVLVVTWTLHGQAAPQQGRDDAKLVKVTGCLGGGPSKFTLTNAAVSKTPDTKDEQASGRSVVTDYELTPRDGVSLGPHVGQRVELTGAVGEIVKDESGAQAPPRGRRGLTAHLAVTAVRMISPICLE